MVIQEAPSPQPHNLTIDWILSANSEFACCISLTDTLSKVLKEKKSKYIWSCYAVY